MSLATTSVLFKSPVTTLVEDGYDTENNDMEHSVGDFQEIVDLTLDGELGVPVNRQTTEIYDLTTDEHVELVPVLGKRSRSIRPYVIEDDDVIAEEATGSIRCPIVISDDDEEGELDYEEVERPGRPLTTTGFLEGLADVAALCERAPPVERSDPRRFCVGCAAGVSNQMAHSCIEDLDEMEHDEEDEEDDVEGCDCIVCEYNNLIGEAKQCVGHPLLKNLGSSVIKMAEMDYLCCVSATVGDDSFELNPDLFDDIKE